MSMNIGIPRERRPFEFRVGMTPAGVQMLVKDGHTCYVEHDAGKGAGFSDQDFIDSGARIAYSGHEVFGRADLVLKVARPTYDEIEWLRPETTIAGLLHLSSARQDKTDLMIEKGITAVAYEHIATEDGSVPIRRPLSQIGGLLAAQIGAGLLQSNCGGKGILMGGVAGVPPAEVVVIGAGVVGTAAIKAFTGMGAHVTVLDIDINALQRIFDTFPGVVTMISYPGNITRACAFADIVVGAVLKHNAPPPIIVNRETVRSMKPRSIIMDISIDEGGCIETARPTTHEKPTFIDEGVIHYCVPNIPSLVARSSTYAFLNAAFPYISQIANLGVEQAAKDDHSLAQGIAVQKGELRNVIRWTPAEKAE
jgi:alanine dehydrogenase